MNRPLTQFTKLATGSLIPGIPFNVRNEEVYNVPVDQIADFVDIPEIGGFHNVASDVDNLDGTHTLTLHQIRMKNESDAGLRPSWSAVDAAEISIAGDLAFALAKRDTIYSSFRSSAAGALNQILDSLSAALHRSLITFNLYMQGRGLIINAKGRVIGFTPVEQAPYENHYHLVVDGEWLTVSLNPNWNDFIA